MTLCRICLYKVEPSNCVYIFTDGRNDELLSDMIMNFAYVEVFEDDCLMPNTICSSCRNKLYSVYDFKDLIIKSDSQLRKQLDCDENNTCDLTLQDEENSSELLSQSPFVKCEEKEDDIVLDYCDLNAVEHSLNGQKVQNNLLNDTCDLTTQDEENSSELPSQSSCVKCEEKENDGVLDYCDLNAVERSMNDKKVQNNLLNEKTNKTEQTVRKRKRKIFKCEQCEKTFKNRYNLITHYATHTGVLPHSCDVCDKGFPTNWAMNVHRRVHYEERPFKCEFCDKSFKTKSGLIIHRKIHQGIKPHQCKICGKTFVQIGGLRAHQYIHTKEKPLVVCEFCGKHYSSRGNLEHHLRIHKNEPDQPCPICGKFYSGITNLKRHIKIHSGERQYFHCEVCGKKFTKKGSLNIHLRIHKGVKPYSCEICGKRFTQANCVTRHMRIHTGDTPYPCTMCKKSFSYSHHLVKHMKKEHASQS